MKRILRYSILLMPVAFVLAFVPAVAAHVQDANKTIFFAAVDKNTGKAVTDLTPDIVAVAEDGKIRPTVSMQKSTQPISMMLLADTSAVVGGAGLDRRSSSASAAGDIMKDIKAAYSEFNKYMMAANPNNEIALMEFGQASILMVNFTSNADDIEKGISKLVSKPNAPSVLTEGIMESAKELGKRKNMRRAILALNVEPADEQSQEPQNNVMKEIAKSRAQFFSISLQKGDLRNSSRGPVYATFAEKTGGKRDTIVGQSALVEALKKYGDFLNSQYEITYSRPQGAPPSVLQMACKCADVKFISTAFPPQ